MPRKPRFLLEFPIGATTVRVYEASLRKVLGDCQTTNYGLAIRVDYRLRGLQRLSIVIHELLHAILLLRGAEDAFAGAGLTKEKAGRLEEFIVTNISQDLTEILVTILQRLEHEKKEPDR